MFSTLQKAGRATTTSTGQTKGHCPGREGCEATCIPNTRGPTRLITTTRGVIATAHSLASTKGAISATQLGAWGTKPFMASSTRKACATWCSSCGCPHPKGGFQPCNTRNCSSFYAQARTQRPSKQAPSPAPERAVRCSLCRSIITAEQHTFNICTSELAKRDDKMLVYVESSQRHSSAKKNDQN